MDLGNIKISESFSVPRNGEYSSSDDPVQGKENLGNFLNDFESYWQDIDDRLTVSRVVSDSVIKGIVNAVSQEATEMVSAKEMIVTELKEQLLEYRRGHLNFQSCFGNNMQDKLKIVSSICQDLDSVQKSLFNLEKLSSHGSLEIDHLHCRVLRNHVEASSRQTESSVSLPETFESSHLKHLKIDELYTYFRDEIAKLKRDHETIIQEITEDYFSLKRDFLKERELLKERGSFFPLKSKDCDALRKTIPDVILKLKDVLSDYEDCCKTCDLSRDTLDNLLMENHNLRDLLNKKVVEIKCLSSQVSEVKAVTKEKEMIIIEEKERSEEVLNKMKDLTAQRLRERALISQKNSELGKLKANLEDCLRKIDQREAQIVKLTKTLELVQLDAKSLLEERDKTCLLLDAKEREYREQTESAVHAIQEMTKAFVNYELRTIESMKWNNVRLENSTFQLGLLLKKVNVLRRTGLLYKQRLERRCSDLQKAEAEVDLLGDEVETLLGLLEKIHIALDHYAPVLQHYPGIMEVLKLVERKLSTECAKSICGTPY